MYKPGGFIGVLIFGLMCFYLVGPSSLGIYCTWQKSESCGNISQVRAEEGGNISFTDSQGLDTQEIVSEKKVEQIEIFRQKQIEEEFELEKQKQYQEKLLEEGKVIVAEYEAQRQEKLIGE